MFDVVAQLPFPSVQIEVERSEIFERKERCLIFDPR